MRKGLVGASITVASIIPLLGVSGSLREARLLCSCNLIITVFFHESQSIRIELDGQLYKFKNKKEWPCFTQEQGRPDSWFPANSEMDHGYVVSIRYN